MGGVILPSRETRYYDRFGNEITGFGSSLEAARFAGDPTAGLELQSNAWPKEWSGRGPLPGGATPTGRSIRNPAATQTQEPEQAQAPAGIPYRVINAQSGGVSTIAAPAAPATSSTLESGGVTTSRLAELLAAVGRLLAGEPV